MAKRKRTITDLQNTTQKTIISPQRYIFSQETKSDFYFLDIKKISNFPSNFYRKFLVENCRAGLMIFLHHSCQFILFL